MFAITRTKELITRVTRVYRLAAVALAALALLSAAPARAQNTYDGATVIHAGAVRVAPGQTLLVSLPGNFQFGDGSVRFITYRVSVYDAAFNLLHQTEPGAEGHEYGHALGLSHYNLGGTTRSGPKEVWIHVESTTWAAPGQAVAGARLAPTFEVVDDLSRRTTVFGVLMPAIPGARD